jgi:hypothetical protein
MKTASDSPSHIHLLPRLPRPNRHPQHHHPPATERPATTHRHPRPHRLLTSQSGIQARAYRVAVRVHQRAGWEGQGKGEREGGGAVALAHEAAAADEGRDLGRLCSENLGSVRPYRICSVEFGRRLGYCWLDVGLCEGPVVMMTM